jgi:hypothetical protein
VNSNLAGILNECAIICTFIVAIYCDMLQLVNRGTYMVGLGGEIGNSSFCEGFCQASRRNQPVDRACLAK